MASTSTSPTFTTTSEQPTQPAQRNRHIITSGSSFEKDISYSRAVVCNGWVFVSGCTGYDYLTSQIAPSTSSQCAQAFLNINSALTAAGSSMKDVVRVRYMLIQREEFRDCWPVIKQWFGDVRPAATMFVVNGLADEKMRIEIEVTAKMLGRGEGENKGNEIGEAVSLGVD